MNKFILSFFYIGLIKKAPGSFGSALAIIFWLLCNKIFPNINLFLPIFLTIILIYGSFFIKHYAKDTGDIDDKSIVLDEVLGQIMVLEIIFFYFNLDRNLLNYENILVIFLSFIAFRIFDITKIFPINFIDKKVKNGFGVMLDDVVAAIFAIIILIIAKNYI